MAPNVKERIINWSVSAATTIIGIIIAFKLSANDADSREINSKLDSKLDKVEYSTDQDKKWNSHEKRHDRENEDDREFKDWMRSEITELRQDVKELIKESK